jgi:hypothetical protein
MHRTTVVPERDKYWPWSYLSWREYGARYKYTRVFTYPHILHTGKKVRLQIRIDHKMFDIFTSRNVKTKSFNIHSHVRPKCPTKTKMSDQIVGLRECWFSNLSDICQTFWEEYVGPESLIVDTLGVYSIITSIRKPNACSEVS